MEQRTGEGMEETKNERFRRLAQSRGNRLIREIQLLGNLSNTSYYAYSPEDVDDLFEPIQNELDRAKETFSPKRRRGGPISFGDSTADETGTQGGQNDDGQR